MRNLANKNSVFFTCTTQINLSTITLYNVGVIVPKTIEPPVLMSRILTFALATSVVILAALAFTLLKMIPIERPQVFFLLTPTRSTNLVIEPIDPNPSNKEAILNFKQGFIKEYVTARNTLDKSPLITRENWLDVVKQWSTPNVYNKFQRTKLYKSYIFNETVPEMTCSVNFDNVNDEAIRYISGNNFIVKFAWICKNENIGGQTTQKNYKIQIRIESELDKNASGLSNNLEKLRENPLGILVSEYTVMDDSESKGDPLNSDEIN